MPSKTQGRFLAQFTDHATYEVEVNARDDNEALQAATSVFRTSATQSFTLIERDITDWTVVPMNPGEIQRQYEGVEQPLHCEAPDSDTSGRTPKARMMAEQDLQDIAEMLIELNDVTLHQATFEKTRRLLDLIRPS